MFTFDAAKEEAGKLERKYGRVFLEHSLHGAAMRWRALTAPNAEEMILAGRLTATGWAEQKDRANG